ncbi:uncharacterized protein LOC128201893 [Galleria mellonella]|uniref:Uncharacterized protein LOC128201893 n=1 Tax=Galleria mellonella TaxID=7137 RepID=A0ABM3MYE6_GALME|nr:uncharacterized protein LOC128201893 [Galleria mellonella]
MNMFIWRTYLIITALETKVKGYLEPLHRQFVEKYPDMKVSKQRVGDQRRAILRNKLLPSIVLTDLRKEVSEILNQENQLLPETTFARNSSRRINWTNDMNESIIRSYYKITQLETNKCAYRKQLHASVIDQFPQLEHLSEQRIADQRRAIIVNKYITDQRLEEIKREVESVLTTPYLQLSLENQICASTNSSRPNNIQTIQTSISQNTSINSQDNDQMTDTNNHYYNRSKSITYTNSQLDLHIMAKFEETLSRFKDTNPTERPYIPKQKVSRKLKYIINYINTKLLSKQITENENFIKTHTTLYCAAFTAAICNGTKIKEQRTDIHQTIYTPVWQQRLRKKIEDLRRDIGRMIQYMRGNRSRRLKQHIDNIKNTYKIHTKHEEPHVTDNQVLDTLKQKLNAATSRLKRYVNCTLRKKQNSQFINSEKQFYRQLTLNTQNTPTGTNTQSTVTMPSAEDLHRFWSNIWANPVSHNDAAGWIKTNAQLLDKITAMQYEHVPIQVFDDVIKKMHNWKAPGTDNIHNYWYKKFSRLHPILHNHINSFIENPDTIPEFVTEGITYMIPKDQEHQDPGKYRPITCLQNIYKILTSCLTNLIYNHIERNNILSEEQKGCRKNSRGCKEQLTIDTIAMKIVSLRKKDFSVMYIDYRKAFDSVPHSWLLYILHHYKIHPNIIALLESTMKHWKTKLKLINGSNIIQTADIPIRRGIFQGDALSPLWFCLALNPLSQILNESDAGLKISSDENETKLSHLMFMDDIKLYSNDIQTLHKLADLTQTFSNDIYMQFGVDKCKSLTISNGKIINAEYELNSGDLIEPLDPHSSYKYLGFQQSRQIHQKQVKQDLIKKFKHRLNALLRSQLNSRNLTKAINTYAIPVLTYSFGIINWTKTDLKNLQRIINTTLTTHRKHHPKSCIQRLTLPRHEGGRGISDITNLHNKQITNLRNYFYTRAVNSNLHKVIIETDMRLTPLNLRDRTTQGNEKITDNKDKILTWQQKSLHGRHQKDLQQHHVDKKASNAWLIHGDLFPETEAFAMAIQDQVINTKNYQKHITHTNISVDICRRCHEAPETIQHITGACT